MTAEARTREQKMSETRKTVLEPVEEKFILHWGEMGTKWGINRTVAQVHALLYLAAKPMPADEISTTLSVARSNVSTSLRELQGWKLVHLVPRMGERRDRFHTPHDLWEMFLTVVEQRVEREVAPTIVMLRRCAEEARKDKATEPVVTSRIAAMSEFLGDMHDWYGQMKRLPAATLRSLIPVGKGLSKLLPGARRGGAR
jgi:DNA-binding transcriptional regulator GbsR (MarR family)